MSAIIIHALVANYAGSPIHLIGLSDPNLNGNLFIAKEGEFNVKLVSQEGHVIVTDSSEMVTSWQLAFNEDVHMDEVINIYHQRKAANLFKLDNAVRRHDPHQSIQVGKIDEKGMKWRFDSKISNGVIATLLLIWASSRTNVGQILADFHEDETKQQEEDLTAPFWF